jgi:hypothetical protein
MTDEAIGIRTMISRLEHIMECEYCDVPFDPIRHRWLCPRCKQKNSCCNGAPLDGGNAGRYAATDQPLFTLREGQG